MESVWETLASAGPVILAGLGIYIAISPVVATGKKGVLVVAALIIIGSLTSYATWRVLHSATLSMQKTLAEMTGGDGFCYIMARRVMPYSQPAESHFYMMNYNQVPCFNYSAAFRLIPASDDPLDVRMAKGTTNIRVLLLETVLPVDGVLTSVILDVSRGIYPVGNPGPQYHMRRPPEAKQCATQRRSGNHPEDTLRKTPLRPRDFFRNLLNADRPHA